MPTDPSAAAAIIGNHVRTPRLPGDKHNETDTDPTAWERLPDLPSSDEILDENSSDNLPWFPINHIWNNKAEYLEALYRILRFEGVEGLRYSVKNVKDCPSMGEDDNTCIYTKVHVKGYLFAKLGPIARVSFSTSRAGLKIKWKQSKRLQAGKLVALSTDFFRSDCRTATIAQRPIEGGLDQSPPIVDIIWANADQAIIDPDQELVMVESRNGYYEAVRHALKGLQRAAQEWSPLDKYVVSLDKSDLPCSSVAKVLNFSSLVDHLTAEQLRFSAGDKMAEQEAFRQTEDRFKDMKRKNLNNLNDIKPYTSLDDSQLEALERMITKEVAIVQGPPGTGKTFTSVKSITAILRNRRAGDPPIIVSAQTNHALDQLLIYCKSAGANIMRVGGRTDNDDIAQRTMYELRLTAKLGGQGKYLDKQRLMMVDRFESLVHGVFGGTGLLDPQTLLDAGVLTEAQHKSFADEDWEGSDDMTPMETWLGSEKITRIRQMDDLDFDEFEAPDEIELEENLNDEQVDEDDDPIRGRFVALSSQHTGQRPQIASWESRCRALLGKYSNLYDIPRGYRGGVYQIMELKLREATSAKFRSILDEAIRQSQEYKASGWIRDLRVIDRHCIDIIGCTTTGLTKYRGFLSAVQPRILLIEEAAETREANIASALFPSLQQLILVGDHQQLPPSCDIARLAKDPYNLNISLFERLVVNSLPYTMLNRQRRMAPELRTIVQKFYPKLKDHLLVTDNSERPLVPGLGERRSWFFTHQWPEDTDADNSKFNQAEVEMVVSFVRYLLHNGVDASEITILTYYKGQKRKLLHRLRQRFPTGKFFNVSTVDSYQGEENEIVILSLVRSPGSGRDYRVGFLDSRNRATVAISRARRGFFMFGNKENMLNASIESFTTWAPIWNAFAEQRRVAMSKGMPLVCQNHGNEIWVKDADDLVGNAGGCWTQCTDQLRCGHACGLMCHITSHDLVPCTKPCTRTLECGHKCAGYCTDPCQCSINCPEYVEIRLKMQLAQARLHAQSQITNSRASSPARLTASASGSSGSAVWQGMVQDPDAYDRRERLKTMGDIRLTKDTFQTAFGGIKETYIAVSDRGGRRVQAVGNTTDMREDTRLKQKVPATDRSTGTDSSRTSQHVNGSSTDGEARVPGQTFNGRAPNSGRSTIRGGNQNFRGSPRAIGGSHGGLQGSRSSEAPRPASINITVANASAATIRAQSNRQANGGDFQTVRPPIQQNGNGATTSWPVNQEAENPDSASLSGELGFDEELCQAIRRAEQSGIINTRQTSPRIKRCQDPVQNLTDGTESLINFGNNSVVSVPRKLCNDEVKNAESLINFGPLDELSMLSLDDKLANEEFLLD